ncbi:MAG: S41 family peptidase [Bdellovibrionales bacterium]
MKNKIPRALKKMGLIVFTFFAMTTAVSILSPAWAQDRYNELQNFAKVLNLIQQYYVEEVDTKKLILGAIRGMLRELDPHTNYMPPDLFKEFENETSGEFGGLGIEISVQNGILTIISPIEDTPAYKAGIKAGDRVVAIDGQSTKGLSLVEASQFLRGKKGSSVTLKIVRENQENPLDITIVRGNVKIKSVKYTDLDDGFAYIKVTSFIENTVKDLSKTIEDHLSRHKKVSGLLIDLRKNPGGLLDQAVKMSDLFLREGVIVSTVGRSQKDKEVTSASKKGKYTDFPIVVLVDQYSASASEIVSGALQDNKRALIVGERTFGKGSVQSIIKLQDGSGLKLTVARYFTPRGISIQAEGITPDIEIEEIDTEAFSKAIVKNKGTREKDIQNHLKGEREKEEEANQKNKGLAIKPDNAQEWWKDYGSHEKNLTAKQKLFQADYQAYQAYNYLKAWKTLRSISY